MHTNLPLDANDERPLQDVFRSFYPSDKGLVQYSEDIRQRLVDVRSKSTKKVLEFVREITQSRMRIEELIREAIKESLGDDAKDDRTLDAQITLGEFDGSSVDQRTKSELILTMLEERRDLIIRITEYLHS